MKRKIFTLKDVKDNRFHPGEKHVYGYNGYCIKCWEKIMELKEKERNESA